MKCSLPAVSPACTMHAHQYGPVLTCLTSSGRLCSVGEDGALLLYDVNV